MMERKTTLLQLVRRYRTYQMMIQNHPDHKEMLERLMEQCKLDILNLVTSDKFLGELELMSRYYSTRLIF